MEQQPRQREASASDRRIRIDAKNSIVRVFVGGLTLEETSEAIKQGYREVFKLLNERASHDEHKPPFTLRLLDANGRVLRETRGPETIWNEHAVIESIESQGILPPSQTLIEVYEGEDGNGQKVSVRVEIEGVRKN